MKNSKWREYSGGKPAGLPDNAEVDIKILREMANTPPVEGRDFQEVSWQCLWCNASSPIGLAVCEKCGMPRITVPSCRRLPEVE